MTSHGTGVCRQHYSMNNRLIEWIVVVKVGDLIKVFQGCHIFFIMNNIRNFLASKGWESMEGKVEPSIDNLRFFTVNSESLA